MDIVGQPATHQDVISRVTDQTSGPAHIVIFVRVDNCAAGCQAGDGMCATVRNKDLLTRGTDGDIVRTVEQVGSVWVDSETSLNVAMHVQDLHLSLAWTIMTCCVDLLT